MQNCKSDFAVSRIMYRIVDMESANVRSRLACVRYQLPPIMATDAFDELVQFDEIARRVIGAERRRAVQRSHGQTIELLAGQGQFLQGSSVTIRSVGWRSRQTLCAQIRDGTTFGAKPRREEEVDNVLP